MTEFTSLPKPKAVVFLAKAYIAVWRVLLAAFLGLEVGAMLSAAFNLHDGLQDVVVLSGVAVCIIFARNRLLLLFGLTIILYFVGLGYSRHKIDNFCSSVMQTTHPSELTALAERAHVKFRAGPDRDRPGEFFGLVCDPFSMCETSCKIGYDKEHILWKSPQGGGLPPWQPPTSYAPRCR